MSELIENCVHDWSPTTNTFAVFECKTCHAIGFDPHPLPKVGRALSGGTPE